MVRKGYKQTEVGVIPKDWEVKKFLKVTDAITCGVAATPIYVSEQVGRPFLSAQNVRKGQVVYDGHKYISKELFEQITKTNKPVKGDILYTRVGAGIGEAGVIKDDFEFGIYVSLTLIKCKRKLADSIFICHLLNSEPFKHLAKNGQFAGGGVQNLNVEVVREFDIPLPSIPEQQTIAKSLSDVDNLINGLDKLIAKKRDIKTATMQQLLTGKTRLSDFDEGKGYKQTELGVVPEVWESLTIGDIASFIGGSQPPRSTFVFKSQKGYMRLIQIRDYKSDKDETYIPEELARKKCDKNDVMIGRYGPPIFQILRGIKGAYNVALIKAVPKDKIDRNYLYYSLKGERLFTLMEGLSQRSSGQTGVELPALKNYPLPLPPFQEQQAIITVLSDMDKELDSLQTRLDKTKSIKLGMMQELLTGKTRLI